MDCQRSDLFAPASSSPPVTTGMAAVTLPLPGKPAPNGTHRRMPRLDAAGWLIAVNEQISFECTYGATSLPGEAAEVPTVTLERMTSQPGSTIKAAALRDFPLFADFSDGELRQLLRLMRRWDLPRGTLVVNEGGPGGSCFIIVSGSVDVTVRVRGYQQLLAQLPAPAAFSVRSA